jgi:hypothetical protein
VNSGIADFHAGFHAGSHACSHAGPILTSSIGTEAAGAVEGVASRLRNGTELSTGGAAGARINPEERNLVQAFGERYRQYTRDVRMLLPLPKRSAEPQSTAH